MGIRIIDRRQKEQVLEDRLEFIRSMVESEMQLSQAGTHTDESARIAEIHQKFDLARLRLTTQSGAANVAKDVDSAIRQQKGGAFKAQSSLEIKKLLDLI